jgi:hypothetical protein
VQQAGENEGDIVCDPLPVKAREESGGRCPVKAFVVIEDPNSQSLSLDNPCSMFYRSASRAWIAEAQLRTKR